MTPEDDLDMAFHDLRGAISRLQDTARKAPKHARDWAAPTQDLAADLNQLAATMKEKPRVHA